MLPLKRTRSFSVERFARAGALMAAACLHACAPVDDADAARDSEVVATTEGLVVSMSAQSDWVQVGQGQTYTNWEQDVVIVEPGQGGTASIQGSMVFGPHWTFLLVPGEPAGSSLINFRMDAASGTRAAPNGTCRAEGKSSVCEITVPNVIGKTVRLMLIKSNRTDGTDLWWSAWARVGNVGYYVGQLRTPYQGAIVTASNISSGWSEQPGDISDPIKCVNQPKRLVIVYGAPTVSSPVLSAHKLKFLSGSAQGCGDPDAFAGPFYDGTVHAIGK